MKRTFYTEAAYAICLAALALGTALMERADFGMSMVVAPAYLIYLKVSGYISWFTFGMAEYCLLELPCAASPGSSGTEDGGAGRHGMRLTTVFATHGHVYNPHHLPPLKDGDILLNGHTHIPACEEILDMNGRTCRYLNPGSVSIPKEGSAHSYMVWEDGAFIWKNLEGEEYMTWKTDSRF